MVLGCLWGVCGCWEWGWLEALGAGLGAWEHPCLCLSPLQLPPATMPVAMAPPRLRALLGRWRGKVFALLVQLRMQEEAQRGLRAQVGARTLPG